MVPRPSSIIQILSSFKKLLTPDFFNYLSSKKKNLLLLYSHVTYLYLINYTYSP